MTYSELANKLRDAEAEIEDLLSTMQYRDGVIAGQREALQVCQDSLIEQVEGRFAAENEARIWYYTLSNGLDALGQFLAGLDNLVRGLEDEYGRGTPTAHSGSGGRMEGGTTGEAEAEAGPATPTPEEGPSNGATSQD